MTQLAFLASIPAATIILSNLLLLHTPSPINAEPHSTIPRSNNRYTHYANSSSDSSLDTLSSPLNRESYHPPWNPSPKIDSTTGFLSDLYPRSPGEWEPLANIRGKHGPRNPSRYVQNLSVPVRIRQVPGDGNCLFHSIAACLHFQEHGSHLPMDSYECFGDLRGRSLQLRNAAVDVLQSTQNGASGNGNGGVVGLGGFGGGGRRRLFLQGEEYLEARELLSAAAAQFDLDGEEYCELMRKESYWGGGPEIVALCNYLQRPIHIYELIPADEATNLLPSNNKDASSSDKNNNNNSHKHNQQFNLRRMACFGSPKFDRREPLHILSADSRFPDIEPRRIRKVGNHFLALFPATSFHEGCGSKKKGDEEGNTNTLRFKRHALIRGGSRVAEGGRNNNNRGSSSEKEVNEKKEGGGRKEGKTKEEKRSEEEKEDCNKATMGKWDGGRGSWTPDLNLF
eukprot:CAMPEP_0183711680 /NCGR_PEP_ID=MMETSP0737-20130205/7130_1 /TAXON_ID=385413 /ORGANISM="Thalassiosira miniscula, Strain CCMP1093" /LENGTH=453 /DNA_ID=CAMNT_0025940247 /DNA_START=122 /DNA_END=1483 /DNA_ORIENTATION=-